MKVGADSSVRKPTAADWFRIGRVKPLIVLRRNIWKFRK